MKSANSQIALFREAISLEEKRSALQIQLDQLTGRLSEIQRELLSNEPQAAGSLGTFVAATKRPGASEPRAAAPASSGGRKRRTGLSKRGKLSDAIHAALKEAGSSGLSVGELAQRFGVPNRNLFVWFATTGKKYKAVKKIAPGHYRLAN
jgi:hypothetical protein